jgi:nucleobase:cation symporter-1, NCS1 family
MPAKGVSQMAVADIERTEVPPTLTEAPPRLLGLWDQTVLWGNLGISILLLPVGALLVMPAKDGGFGLSLTAAMAAIAVGGVIGNAMLGLAAVPGAETGAPSMVLLRGLFGVEGSWVPTALNVAQLIGWTTFEIWIIATSAGQITSPGWKPVFAVAAGIAAIVMAIRPLGTIRGYLRLVAVWAVLLSSAYLFVEVLRQPLPPWSRGSWTGFWGGADLIVALAVSWIPLAADYSRHSRSGRAAFGGAFAGYLVGASAFFVLGAVGQASRPGGDVVASLLAIPVGTLALLILTADEIDEAFANLYSTTISLQNVRPSLDRRVAAVVLGAGCTGLALLVDGNDYEKFLLLIGSVFVPLFGTFAADYFLVRRGRWDVSESARPRWRMLVPWLAGFAVYQLASPGQVHWWSELWGNQVVHGWWASASLLSFTVSGLLALAVGRLPVRWEGRSGRRGPATRPGPRGGA